MNAGCRVFFLILLTLVLALGAWQWRHGAPLSANLMELVPGTAPDALEQQAEQRMQEPLNREILVLVGHAERQQAVAMARQLAEQWQASGLFEKVQWNLQADLPALRQQLLQGRLAMLGAKDREQLAQQPQAFIQQRVQSLFDPFGGFTLVPSQDDWLGLTGRIQNSQPQHGAVQLDIGSGALVAEADGQHWVLLRARTGGNAFDMQLPLQVADLLRHSRDQASQQQVQLLAASGLLYAANGQQQAPGKSPGSAAAPPWASFCCCCWPSAAGVPCWPSSRCWWACCSAPWPAWRCSAACT